ncbi:hypothetical protein E2C01_012929 [Portunus trituberculatus]|uniref:Uncharacterized protein n=1 Tax=Portunus trituberculatus TaxID=210409 RepID=A0A5B7DFR4_PORTR|nr:hypothetical protein [Portunus trituberculatus]
MGVGVEEQTSGGLSVRRVMACQASESRKAVEEGKGICGDTNKRRVTLLIHVVIQEEKKTFGRSMGRSLPKHVFLAVRPWLPVRRGGREELVSNG